MKKYFNEMVEVAVMEHLEEVENGEEYKELSEKANELFNQLKKIVPESHKRLLFDLESVENERNRLMELKLYEQGLKDGVELRNILKIS